MSQINRRRVVFQSVYIFLQAVVYINQTDCHNANVENNRNFVVGNPHGKHYVPAITLTQYKHIGLVSRWLTLATAVTLASGIVIYLLCCVSAVALSTK